jgi:hypothetical protein
MIVYVLTWTEAHGFLHVLGVSNAAKAAFADIDRFRRKRKLEWSKPWVWAESEVHRGCPDEPRRVFRSAVSPTNWPGGHRAEYFGVLAYELKEPTNGK